MNELLQEIFSLEDPIGRTIVNWIRVFFWIGVINYGVHIGRILYESACLIYVKKYIKDNHGLGEISPDLLNNLGKSTITRIGLRLSAIYRRIRDLVNIKQNGGEIDNDVLGDIHAGAASRRAGLSNYILGILIILGLVGTLWGLTTAVIKVQPLLQDIDDLDQLPQISNALQETLKGMATAFKTTLAGLVTSLGLGALGWLFNLSNSAFLTKFETVVSTEIVPHFTQAPESVIESSMDRLQASVDEFRLATEDNVRKMEGAIGQLTEQSWDAYLEQQYVITQELREIPAELRESLEGINGYQVLIKSTVESSEETAKQFMNKISEFQTTVDTMANDFTGLTERSISQVSEYQSAVESIANDFEEFTERSMSQVTEYQSAVLAGLEGVVSEFRQESAGLETTIRGAQDSQARFVDELANNLAVTLANTLETQLQSILQPITDSQQVMIDTLREGELEISSALSQVSDYHATLLAGLENVVLELKEESAGLKTTIREAQSSQARFVDELANNLADTLTNTLETQLQSTLQPITDSQQVMIDRLREGELKISSALENQNQVFERISTDLITNRHEVGNRLSLLIGQLQIKPTLEAQNEVFGQIEEHLQGQRELVDAQREIMQTLDTSVKQLERTFSSAASDEQQRTEQMLKQLSSNFETLSEKIGALNHTMNQPGFSRWGSEIGRWFRGDRK